MAWPSIWLSARMMRHNPDSISYLKNANFIIMKELFEVAEWIAQIIEVIGVIILLVGFSRGFVKYLQLELNRFKGGKGIFSAIQIVRCDIGQYILLALDFIIASDIISSLIHTNLEELLNLGIIVIIRTVIGYFLSKEIDEIHQKT